MLEMVNEGWWLSDIPFLLNMHLLWAYYKVFML
jgi:hypothetical protein